MLIAATSSNGLPTDFAGALLQYGLVGLLLLDVTLTHRLFVPRWVLDRQEAERDRERQELKSTIDRQAGIIDRLTSVTEQQVIPALTGMAERDREYLHLLQEKHRGRG